MKNDFDNKNKEYAIGRPSYPKEILNVIKELEINKSSTIADIGAGTGLLTKLLGELGCKVLAVEPNLEMLNECKNYCSTYKNIEYLNTSAEKTKLEDKCIDIITIAQAFHWFDKELSKLEFKRILKDDGNIIILWNDMQTESDFAKEYTNLLYKYRVKTTAGISNFDPDQEKLNFFGKEFTKIYYDNYHSLTEEVFIDGALSLSYTPSRSDNNYEFVNELHLLFMKYQKEGSVTLHYKTEISIGSFL